MYSQHAAHHHHGHGGDTAALASQPTSFDSMGQHHTGAPWSQQDMHYGGTNGSNTAYASGASHGLYGSGGYYGSSSVQPSGGAYSAYSLQQQQQQQQPQSGATTGAQQYNSAAGGNGSLANGAMGGSAHHSGASTPTSQSAYGHHHQQQQQQQQHGMGSVMPSPQGYASHHQQSGYYGSGASGNQVMSPSYTSAPQYSTQLPLAGRHRVTTTLWEDEGTLCFQVDARGVCVARRHDNNMINGTKLLNVCGMSRGKRDGILKNEKERIVVKVGAMHLKGVWITFQRGKQLAEQNGILDVLYPLFETNIQSFLYHPDNYPRTAAVMAAAHERQAQRSRAPVAESPTGYPRSASQSQMPSGAVGASGHAGPAASLMRSNAQSNGPMAPGTGGYGQHNGYTSAPSHSPSGHGVPPPPQPHAMQGGGLQRASSIDRRPSMPMNNGDMMSPYQSMLPKQRTPSGFKRGLDDGTDPNSFGP